MLLREHDNGMLLVADLLGNIGLDARVMSRRALERRRRRRSATNDIDYYSPVTASHLTERRMKSDHTFVLPAPDERGCCSLPSFGRCFH